MTYFGPLASPTPARADRHPRGPPRPTILSGRSLFAVATLQRVALTRSFPSRELKTIRKKLQCLQFARKASLLSPPPFLNKGLTAPPHCFALSFHSSRSHQCCPIPPQPRLSPVSLSPIAQTSSADAVPDGTPQNCQIQHTTRFRPTSVTPGRFG